ncbi:MAG: ABC transporter permease [Chloroflexota bacterium]
MIAFVVRRVLLLIPVLLFVSGVTFSLMHLTPGGPWDQAKPVSGPALANLNAKYHLDLPAPEQYLLYLRGALHGNFGPSYQEPDRTVAEIVGSGIGITAQLGALALLFALAAGLPLGTVAALRHRRLADHLSTLLSVAGYAVPNFVVSTFAIVLVAATWHLLPTGGWDGPRTWILPSIALGLAPAAAIARYTRSSLLDVLGQDYVRTARAKGVFGRLLVGRHELRNALLPVLTILGPTVAYLLTGSFVIEQAFNIPGIGRDFVQSVLARDYPMILATVMIYAATVALANLLVDVGYALLDPRIAG